VVEEDVAGSRIAEPSGQAGRQAGTRVSEGRGAALELI
jgi:hypothetical protein